MAGPPGDDEDDDDEAALAALIEQATLPVGIEAATVAARLFEERLRLPFPPLPHELAHRLRRLDAGLFTTRLDAADPSDLAPLLRELRAGPVADYVLFGQSGHGAAGSAMHFCCVQPSLALFVQILWGGAYGDDLAATSEIGLAFDRCAQLLTAPGREHLPAGRRLVAVHSDLLGHQLGWLDERGHGELEPERHPIEEALALISLR